MNGSWRGEPPRDPTLRDALAAVDAWRGREIACASVPGGITNSNWRIRVEGEPCDLFVKLPGAGTELFIDRAAAHDASVAAARSGYGARVLHYIPELGVEIFEFLEGVRAATNADFQRQTVRRNATRALRAFNEQPPLALTKTVFDMIDEHLETARSLGAALPDDIDWLIDNYEFARGALQAAGIDVAPCMNDTLAANFMLDSADGVRLVDFEYASNNDVCYELALWLGEMFFEPAAEREVLEEYFGTVTAPALARIQVYKALADMKWATWAMIQRVISPVEFDYHKYGTWKYLRARTVIGHPLWERWLGGL